MISCNIHFMPVRVPNIAESPLNTAVKLTIREGKCAEYMSTEHSICDAVIIITQQWKRPGGLRLGNWFCNAIEMADFTFRFHYRFDTYAREELAVCADANYCVVISNSVRISGVFLFRQNASHVVCYCFMSRQSALTGIMCFPSDENQHAVSKGRLWGWFS